MADTNNTAIKTTSPLQRCLLADVGDAGHCVALVEFWRLISDLIHRLPQRVTMDTPLQPIALALAAISDQLSSFTTFFDASASKRSEAHHNAGYKAATVTLAPGALPSGPCVEKDPLTEKMANLSQVQELLVQMRSINNLILRTIFNNEYSASCSSDGNHDRHKFHATLRMQLVYLASIFSLLHTSSQHIHALVSCASALCIHLLKMD